MGYFPRCKCFWISWVGSHLWKVYSWLPYCVLLFWHWWNLMPANKAIVLLTDKQLHAFSLIGIRSDNSVTLTWFLTFSFTSQRDRNFVHYHCNVTTVIELHFSELFSICYEAGKFSSHFSFQSLLLGTSEHNDKIKVHTSSKALDTLNMVDYQGISLIFPILWMLYMTISACGDDVFYNLV